MKVNEIITETFLTALKGGEVPWRMPWDMSSQKNLKSKKGYSGINVFLLMLAKKKGGFKSNFWLTYKQADAMGGTIKKGSKGAQVIFWKLWEKDSGKKDAKGAAVLDGIPILRYYTVFNVDQIDGIDAPAEDKKQQNDPIETAEKIVSGFQDAPKIDWTDETRAYYVPAGDYINMPDRKYFHSPEQVYATLFHELAHSTGHKSRLKRREEGAAVHFGDDSYSREELTAELGSAFLCGEAGIGQAVIKNQHAYIQNWIKALKNDPGMIIQAAGKAQKAFDYILGRKKTDEKPA